MFNYSSWTLLLLLFQAACSLAHSEEIHIYTEHNGNRTIDNTWKMIESQEKVKILVTQQDDQYFENIYDREKGAIHWMLRTKTRNITATREGTEISIIGSDGESL